MTDTAPPPPPVAADGFRIVQVGIVVRDLEDAVRSYTETFGWGPWRGFDAVPPRLEERIDGGAGWRVAIATVGELDVELVQPLDELSQHGRFLRDHGPGINHVLVRQYRDGEEVAVPPTAIGAPLITDGTFGPIAFGYVDGRERYGAIFEVVTGSTASLLAPDRIYPAPSSPPRPAG